MVEDCKGKDSEFNAGLGYQAKLKGPTVLKENVDDCFIYILLFTKADLGGGQCKPIAAVKKRDIITYL